MIHKNKENIQKFFESKETGKQKLSKPNNLIRVASLFQNWCF